MKRALRVSLVMALGLLAAAQARGNSPWEIARLQQTPRIEWLGESDQGAYVLKRLCFENEPYDGQATRLFAFLAIPKGGDAKLPGIVLVHGGAGKAFLGWAEQWAGYGYAALAIDLNGRDDQGAHLPDGGPVMGEATLITDIARRPLRDLWPYQGIAAAIRGVSILRAEARVDAGRVGMMGISWGAYVTAIAASLDARIAFATLVYGSGFFQEGGSYKEVLDRLAEKDARAWTENYDPSVYLPALKAPVFWLTGTNDSFFSHETWTKSHQLTASSLTVLRVLPQWPHGYEPAWNTAECRVFADGVTRSKPQLVTLGAITVAGKVASAAYAEGGNPAAVELIFTTDRGPWPQREWSARPARLLKSAGRVEADLPADVAACFFNLTDKRGLVTSSPCRVVGPVR